jgi:hypothetical protein
VVRFYLDGIEMESPLNWVDFNLNLKRDKSIDALLLVSDTTLEWMGSGYVYLVNLIESGGFCGSAELRVTDDESPEYEIFNGRIFLSATEIDEGICTIKTKVEDRSFYAMINNNKSIEVDLTAGLSKNKVAITPVDDYMIDCHAVTTNVNKRTVYSVRVDEAFRYLVAFMTDDTVQYVSDTFGAGGEWEGLCITTGLKLRGALGPGAFNSPPLTQFSFKELYEEVRKKIPIGITIDEAAGVYTLRIEGIDYFNQGSGSFAFKNIDKIRTKFNEDKLYASIKVGSGVIDQTKTFPEVLPVLGWREEQLFNNINCNTDNELDLVSEWVIASNVIEDCVTSLSDLYDEDLFLITTTYVNDLVGICTATDIFNANDWYYNDQLRNINVLQRYANGIPDSALQSFNGTPSGFYAWQTSSYDWNRRTTISAVGCINNAPTGTWVNSQMIFNDDVNTPGFDPNGVYFTNKNIPPVESNVFTAPVSAYYTFKVFVNANITGILTGNITTGSPLEVTSAPTPGLNNVLVRVIYNIRDSTGAVIASSVPIGTISTGYYRYTHYPPGTTNGPYTVNNTNQVFSIGQFLNSGDNLYINALIDYNDYDININAFSGVLEIKERVDVSIGSYFTCLGNSTDNTTIVVGDINEYIAYEHSFDYPMTASEFLYVKNNPRNRVAFSMFGKADRYGWISDLKYNWNKGTATVKLESNTKNNA